MLFLNIGEKMEKSKNVYTYGLFGRLKMSENLDNNLLNGYNYGIEDFYRRKLKIVVLIVEL